MPIRKLFKECAGLRKQGQADRAMALLGEALRRGGFTGEQIDRAGRFIQRELKEDAESHRVLMLGQCTTAWVSNALAAHAWGRGMAVAVRDGEYDNVMQDLLSAASAREKIDTVVFLPWPQRLLGGEARSASRRVEEEVTFWGQAWSIAREQLKARVIQIGYDTDTSGPTGTHLGGAPDGPIGLIREANRALRDGLPDGAFFVDLERVAGRLGREVFYDPRRYHWTKQPFSETGASALAEHLASALRAVTTGPKKVLVLDLDNTLWGGVVGEAGPLGITLGESPDGEAFRAFQKYLKGLARRGVVLAVCSKNNPEDAREPFEKNPDMALSLEDFAAFEASWDSKPEAIERIAQTLELGLDSFVFFDDNPAEREHVRQALPGVEVVDVPADPSGYVRALESGGWFEAVGVTGADRQRAQQYATERKRRDARQSFGSIEDYLGSLKMVGDIRGVCDADMQRVVQLIARTNQFNLTTRRHTEQAVRAMLGEPGEPGESGESGAVGLTLRLSDKFGDHGLVSLLLAVPDADNTLRIDTWLMSCRVIGRTAEAFMFQSLLENIDGRGYQRIVGEYLPTKKNPLVADLYDRMGFDRVAEHADGRIEYELDVTNAKRPTTFIRPTEVVRG